MSHLLIDGYNLIRQTPQLARHEKISLELGRKALVQKLSRYKKIKGHKITVVFDGHSELSEFAATATEAGIALKFSPTGQKADDVIKDMVKREGARLIVVTSDREILLCAQHYGAGYMRSPEFYEKLVQADHLSEVPIPQSLNDKDEPKHKRWATYKKGPKKRLPKKERRNQTRLKDL